VGVDRVHLCAGLLHIGLADGQTIVGSVETVNGKFNVITQTAGVVAASKESIQFIRNSDEQTRIQAMSANAARATTRDKIAVYYTSIFSSSDFSGGTSQTTANSKRGGVSYNLNLNKKAFVFGAVDLESDQFQSLDLRFTPSGGAGYHAIATVPTQLDLRLGAAANREFFSTGLNRTSAELLLGDNFVHKFSETTRVEQKLDFFTNLSDTGAYRVNFDISGVTTIRKWLSGQLRISDRFLSNPVPGRKKIDAIFSTGVRVSFAK
jgi:putative salt-induced outer membrane protein